MDYVVEKDGEVITNIMYCNSKIQCDNGDFVSVMTFGPVSVLPKYQGKGYGSKLIKFTMGKAKKLGCGALAITGDPKYYRKFGFVSGHSMNIYYDPFPRNEEIPFFMVKELQSGYLSGVIGTFKDLEGYIVEDAEVEKFDTNFPTKEKKILPGQLS